MGQNSVISFYSYSPFELMWNHVFFKQPQCTFIEYIEIYVFMKSTKCFANKYIDVYNT